MGRSVPGDLVKDINYSESLGLLIAIDPMKYNDLRSSKVLDAYVLWAKPPGNFLQGFKITALPGNTVSTTTITVNRSMTSMPAIPNFVAVVKKTRRKCRKKRR